MYGRSPLCLTFLWLFAIIVPSLSVSSVRAAEIYDLDVQNFIPAMDSRSFLTVERAQALGTFEPTIGLYLSRAHEPLIQRINGRDQLLIRSLLTGQFILSVGFFEFLELGGMLPVNIIRADPDGLGDDPLISGDGLGDMRGNVKIVALSREHLGVGIAFMSAFIFPTGISNAFSSSGQSLMFHPRAIVDLQLGSRVGFAVNGGYRNRELRSISGLVVSTDTETLAVSEFDRQNPIVVGAEGTFGAALGLTVFPERLDVILEGFGATPLEAQAQRAQPLEALLGLKVFLFGNSFFSFGGAIGFGTDYGNPVHRLFAGIVFEPTAQDRDGDGFVDDVDSCPSRPEDVDGYQDTDGCPDEDNDFDGLSDFIDQCPDEPEDKNEFEDEDGCPDEGRDRDQDGVVDRSDKCPDTPEDLDRFKDEDGCPEPDNDDDGVLDGVDQCPTRPEDIDGHSDDDGCPDEDNDRDGFLDDDDKCPDQAENFDGVDDEDGCPEARVVLTRRKIVINEKVFFAYDKALIKSVSFPLLDEVAKTLNDYPQIKRLEVQGHTDSRGADDYNLDLSDRRAQSVVSYLVDQGGVDENRLSARGYGESLPLDPTENEEAWARNRRVEFIILEHIAPSTSNTDTD